MDPKSLCEKVQVYREPRPTNYQSLFTNHLPLPSPLRPTQKMVASVLSK